MEASACFSHLRPRRTLSAVVLVTVAAALGTGQKRAHYFGPKHGLSAEEGINTVSVRSVLS